MTQKKSSSNKAEKDYISDDSTLDEETDPRLVTTPEEREYGTVPGSVQAMQAALAHTSAQTNPTVEWSPPR